MVTLVSTSGSVNTAGPVHALQIAAGYSGQTQPNDRDHSDCTPLLPTRQCSQPTSRAMWEWQDATWHRVNSKDAQVLEAAYSQDFWQAILSISEGIS